MSVPSPIPEAEFEIMRVIWDNPTPITTVRVAALIGETKSWHLSTIKTLLRRLMVRGFLSGEKRGKELYYTPLVTQEDYIKAETDSFMEKFHKKSLRGLMRALYADKRPSDEDIAEMEKWLKAREESGV